MTIDKPRAADFSAARIFGVCANGGARRALCAAKPHITRPAGGEAARRATILRSKMVARAAAAADGGVSLSECR